MDEENLTHAQYLQYINKLLINDKKFLNNLVSTDSDIILFGHTHLQWHAYIKDKILINPGSRGLPLDLNTTAPYTILEITSDKISVEEHRVH